MRHLVEMHGGEARAANATEGTGAVFCIRLPCRSVAPAALAADAHEPPEDGERTMWLEDAPSLAGLRIVVIDDDTDARELMATVLGQRGAQVYTAASAAHGLRLVESELPDVVVADIEMPGEDGYSFVKRLRALPPARGGSTPAAALTAYAGTGDRVKALHAGFDIHMAKPIQPAELATVALRLSGRKA